MPNHTPTLREPETVIVHTHRVSCDGGRNGHPKVFMDMGQVSEVACKYCGKVFVYEV